MSRSGYTCIRYIFCYINVLLWISGCGILGVGIWLKVNHEGYTSLLPQYSIMSADSIFIIIGSITVLVTFFACCGSWFQSRCMLVTYFSLLILMFLLEFLVATLAFMYREHLNDYLKDELLHGIKKHYIHSPENGLEMIWNKTHTKFQCCGINSHEDWYDIDAWPGQKRVPESCCLPKFKKKGCGAPGNWDKWYKKPNGKPKGCSEPIVMWFVSQLHVVGTVGLIVSFFQLFGLISAMLLFCSVKHKRAKGHVYTPYAPT